MSEITKHLEKVSKELHDHVAKHAQTGLHQVRIAEIKFDIEPNPGTKNLLGEDFGPLNCHINQQGQVVCTP
jgi:hypothetical protein